MYRCWLLTVRNRCRQRVARKQSVVPADMARGAAAKSALDINIPFGVESSAVRRKRTVLAVLPIRRQNGT